MGIKLKNNFNWSVIGLVMAIGAVSYFIHIGPLFVHNQKWSK